MFWLSIVIGTLDLSPMEVYEYLYEIITGTISEDDWYDAHIIWDYRVPRALLGIVCGAALGLCGAVMQSVMKNPLADPYTTGVSSGALFGVSISAAVGLSVWKGGFSFGLTVINTLVFSMVPVFLIIAFAPFFRKSPSTLILTGVAVSYLFNAATTLLLVTSGEETLASVYRWQIGSLEGLSWNSLPLVTVVTVLGFIIILPLSKKLNLMALDDKDAKSLGLNTDLMRIICLLLIAVVSGTVICYLGIIGFVGLVIPHITRLIIGSDNKYIIPASGALGAVFLLGCDVITRALAITAEIPVGVVTGLLGAPLFLYLIIISKKKVW